MMQIAHRQIEVRGIGTHYLEAGEGPTLVLLHSGEFGGSAELSWERVLPALAERHRVIAPDWLGYGGTDKVHDFARGGARRISHMTEFLDAVGIDDAAFMGNSMGATLLGQVAAAHEPIWPINALVLISGGGFVPNNPERQVLLDYDGTPKAMRAIMEIVFHDAPWALADDYVQRRVDASLAPGAWEAVAAPRLKAPVVPPRSDFGKPDETPYELIAVPTLVIGGADDRLRLPGYAQELGARIPDARVEVYERCGHVPNLEHPERVVADVLAFLERARGPLSPAPGAAA